jgi:hypothetical protein
MNPALAGGILPRSNLAQLPAYPSTGWVTARVTNSFTLVDVSLDIPCGMYGLLGPQRGRQVDADALDCAVNRVLAKLLRERGFKSDPYPTTLDFLALLRAEAGPAHEQLIVDLIEKITLWDLRVTESEASERPDGKWQVRIEVRG